MSGRTVHQNNAEFGLSHDGEPAMHGRILGRHVSGASDEISDRGGNMSSHSSADSAPGDTGQDSQSSHGSRVHGNKRPRRKNTNSNSHTNTESSSAKTPRGKTSAKKQKQEDDSTQRKLYNRACAACAKLKKKCDGKRPCSRCVEFNISEYCMDAPRKRRGRKAKEGAQLVEHLFGEETVKQKESNRKVGRSSHAPPDPTKHREVQSMQHEPSFELTAPVKRSHQEYQLNNTYGNIAMKDDMSPQRTSMSTNYAVPSQLPQTLHNNIVAPQTGIPPSPDLDSASKSYVTDSSYLVGYDDDFDDSFGDADLGGPSYGLLSGNGPHGDFDIVGGIGYNMPDSDSVDISWLKSDQPMTSSHMLGGSNGEHNSKSSSTSEQQLNQYVNAANGICMGPISDVQVNSLFQQCFLTALTYCPVPCLRFEYKVAHTKPGKSSRGTDKSEKDVVPSTAYSNPAGVTLLGHTMSDLRECARKGFKYYLTHPSNWRQRLNAAKYARDKKLQLYKFDGKYLRCTEGNIRDPHSAKFSSFDATEIVQVQWDSFTSTPKAALVFLVNIRLNDESCTYEDIQKAAQEIYAAEDAQLMKALHAKNDQSSSTKSPRARRKGSQGKVHHLLSAAERISTALNKLPCTMNDDIEVLDAPNSLKNTQT